MNRMTTLIAVPLIAGLILVSHQPPRERGPLFRHGINVSNWLSAARGTGNAIAPRFDSADVVRLRCMGFDFVRLQLRPSGARPDSAFRAGVLARLDTVVRLLNTAGVSVIVDIHPDDPVTENLLASDSAVEGFQAIIRTVLANIREFSRDSVALEIMNEPPVARPGEHRASWPSIQRKLWEAARAADSRRTLLLTGEAGTIDNLLTVPPVPDSLVVYTFHYYTPYHFTYQGATWPPWDKTYYPFIGRISWPPSPAGIDTAMAYTSAKLRSASALRALRANLDSLVAQHWGYSRIRDDIGRAVAWSQQHRVRLLMGEFGAISMTSRPADRARWIGDVRQAADTLKIPWAYWRYWDWPGGFGLTSLGQGPDSAVSAGLQVRSCPH